MERSLITTADGSHSLYVPALNEQYHSRHGAVQESLHVFLHMGLEYAAAQKTPVHILETGFGTGLNALLTWQAARQQGWQVQYTSLEAYPLHAQEWALLNYPAFTLQKNAAADFEALHRAAWETPVVLDAHFTLLKRHMRLEDFQESAAYDLVYFDAFAPEKQPELWTEGIFTAIAAAMHPGACLVTYCAKGSARRAMKAAGLRPEALPGPPGKREMTRAYKA